MNGLIKMNPNSKVMNLNFKIAVEKGVEQDEVWLGKEKVIFELIKKSEQLKRKLQEEKKFGRFLQCLFVLSSFLEFLFLKDAIQSLLAFLLPKTLPHL